MSKDTHLVFSIYSVLLLKDLCLVLFCGVVLGALSSLAIILLRKRELVVLLKLCCDCLCSVSLPHDAVAVIVAVPGHTNVLREVQCAKAITRAAVRRARSGSTLFENLIVFLRGF